MGFGSGVVDPETGIHYQNRGSYFSLEPDHPNVLAPGKRTLHTLMPGMLFRTASAAVGRDRARWAATPSRRSTPRSSRPWSTAARRRERRRRAALVRRPR